MDLTYSISYEEPLVRVRAQGHFDCLKTYEIAWVAEDPTVLDKLRLIETLLRE